MSAVIDADRDRVWRALSEPHEVVRWDERTLAFVDDGSRYPVTGERVRWRYKVGTVPSLLAETPIEISEQELLVSQLAAGSLRMRRSYRLIEEPEDASSAARTRVAMKLSAENSVPVMGAVIDRFKVREMAIELIDDSLRALRKYCEAAPKPEGLGAAAPAPGI